MADLEKVSYWLGEYYAAKEMAFPKHDPDRLARSIVEDEVPGLLDEIRDLRRRERYGE